MEDRKIAKSTDPDYDWLFGDLEIPKGLSMHLLNAGYSPLKGCEVYELFLYDELTCYAVVILKPEDYYSAEQMVREGYKQAMISYKQVKDDVFRRRHIKNALGF